MVAVLGKVTTTLSQAVCRPVMNNDPYISSQCHAVRTSMARSGQK